MSSPIHPQPSETGATLKHLGVLITELGKQIGDSVTARLLSDKETMNSQSKEGKCAQALWHYSRSHTAHYGP